jgi:hypothetical protein
MNGLDSFVITSIAANIAAMSDNQLRLLAKILYSNPNGDRLSYLIGVEQFDADMTNKDPLNIEVQDPVC